MDREPVEERTQRLEFQMAAAQLQLDLTHLVRRVQIVLMDIYNRGSWSPQDTKVSAGFITEAHAIVGQWRELSPPSELRPHWEEILRAFEQFGPQLEAFASLEDVPQGELQPRLASCQSEFTEWLDEANEAERKFAHRESELAVASVQASEDSRARLSPPARGSLGETPAAQ